MQKVYHGDVGAASAAVFVVGLSHTKLCPGRFRRAVRYNVSDIHMSYIQVSYIQEGLATS